MMDITVKIEAPGLMEAIMALAEQLQEHNALLAGKPVPTEAIAQKTEKVEKVQKTTEKEPITEEKAPETEESTPIETVRALVVSSKVNKEKAKAIMTEMGIKKMTELSQEQLEELYIKLQEV